MARLAAVLTRPCATQVGTAPARQAATTATQRFTLALRAGIGWRQR